MTPCAHILLLAIKVTFCNLRVEINYHIISLTIFQISDDEFSTKIADPPLPGPLVFPYGPYKRGACNRTYSTAS